MKIPLLFYAEIVSVFSEKEDKVTGVFFGVFPDFGNFGIRCFFQFRRIFAAPFSQNLILAT